MRLRSLLFLVLSVVPATGGADPTSQRVVIDVHMHAGPAVWSGPGAPGDPVNEAHLREVLSEMDRNNVRVAVISGPIEFVDFWKRKGAERFVASPMFPCDGGVAPLGGRQCFPSRAPFPDLAWLRDRYSSGSLGAMGEITTQYAGLSPADASLEPYYSLAEELDVPVGIHTGLSHPGTPYECCPKFRAALGRPLLLEEVLIRHPKLRVNAMHAGLPFAEEMLAVMLLYPQLHVDVSAINHLMPRADFHSYLRRLVDHGLGKRILYGSDGFPMSDCIDSIESADFLSEEQKTDILCANAARFLRLDADSLCAEAGAEQTH